MQAIITILAVAAFVTLTFGVSVLLGGLKPEDLD